MPKFKIQKSQLQAALGAKFENLFGKMWSIVSYFVIFCNLFNILHDAPAETKVKIQIRGSFNWENPKQRRGLINCCLLLYPIFLPANGIVVKAACVET